MQLATLRPVDHHRQPAVREKPSQAEAGLVGAGERRPFPCQVHAQILLPRRSRSGSPTHGEVLAFSLFRLQAAQ
jgi:hypothetical protein